MMPKCTSISALTAATTIIACLLFARDGQTQGVGVLSSDLAVNFVCPNKSRDELEVGMDDFLKVQGFRVLNLGRIQRDHEVNLQITKVIGLDSDRKIIEFSGFLLGVPRIKVVYAVILRSPPPTRRSPQLEQALLTFVSKGLGCEPTEVSRGENGQDAKEFYDHEISRIENLFREGEALSKPRL
jgi:hypothetical protein